MKNNFLNKLLFLPINPLTVGLFRIAFGLFAFLEIIYFYKTHLIEDYILQPKFLFNYDFLPVTPFPEPMLDAILLTTLISTVFIIAGIFYRTSIIVFFLGFTYFFLLDKSYYNNHLYLFSLVAFLMAFIPADSALTFWKNKKIKSKPLLSWHLRVLQFQFIVVYFFGGLAKINNDWLFHYEPVASLLEFKGNYSDSLAIFLVYAGMLFDLFIGFFLLVKRTRLYAVIAVLMFNVSNHFLFDDINIFPFFMMASLVLFFEVDQWQYFIKYDKGIVEQQLRPITKKVVIASLSLYVFVQLLLPLRHYVIPGNVDWTGEGQRFAWRMKIQSREIVECEFAIFDLDSKTIYPVEMDLYIHELQKYQMIHYPRMILDFAHFLKEDARKRHKRPNTMIKAKISVRFNQRKSVKIFSSDLDLSKEEWNFFSHNQWINTLE